MPNTYVFRTAPGQEVHSIALALGTAFPSNGLDVKEVQHEYDSAQSINTGLNSLLQAFMGLGVVRRPVERQMSPLERDSGCAATSFKRREVG